MSHMLEFRRGADRRRQPRGGRRTGDRDGFAPLVMLVGSEPDVVARSEEILARLKFAVATSDSVEQAVKALPELRPDVLVARESDAPRLRLEAPSHVPVVVLPSSARDPDALLDELLRTLRKG